MKENLSVFSAADTANLDREEEVEEEGCSSSLSDSGFCFFFLRDFFSEAMAETKVGLKEWRLEEKGGEN